MTVCGWREPGRFPWCGRTTTRCRPSTATPAWTGRSLSQLYTCPCLQAGLPPRLCGRGRQGRQQDQQALSPALLRGPRAWSQVQDTWLLVLCRWSSVLAPWSLVLVLGPRALVVSPWSLGLEHWALGIGPSGISSAKLPATLADGRLGGVEGDGLMWCWLRWRPLGRANREAAPWWSLY